MAKVFLDANYFIDAIHRRPEYNILGSLENQTICISTLSIHLYCYIYKIKIPESRITTQREKFQTVDFSAEVLDRALGGPTRDFEDNVQLHSAASAECDIFLTHDRSLLKLKYFGEVEIASKIKQGSI